MIRSTSITLGAAAVPLVALAAAGCGGGGGATAASPPKTAPNPPPKAAARHAATVRVARNAKLGKILVDSRGRTLYLFKKDSGTKSACFGACATAWPPLRANGKPTAGSRVKASKLGTTKRSDGKPQVTYNGHPLYTFVMDTKPGQANGEGVNAFGALWFAVSPAGKQVSAKVSKSAGAPAPPPPAAAAPPANNGIPQNNGGDQDSDNNGGPSDGDGNV
jgi:predicted lipoprotein with Yx(FWY)xxD motif